MEGWVDIAMQSHIQGWAADGANPVSVTIMVGDIKYVVAPNLPRPDLVSHGLPMISGFSFNFPQPLTEADELRVLFPDGTDLGNSPSLQHQRRLRQLLDGVELRRPGLEFGPLDRPILGKQRADVSYVDHASRDDLLAKYRDTGTVGTLAPERLVNVDVVWPSGSLAACIPHNRSYQYAVASHVIEHVPDMIGWLQEIAAVLKLGGVLNLAVPDKERTFDWRRQTTSLSDFVSAYVEKRTRPSARQIFDHCAFVAPFGVQQPEDTANALAVVQDSEKTGAYCDVHCQVFDQRSFLEVMAQIALLGLLPFRLRQFYPTEPSTNEFIVSLERSDLSAQEIHESFVAQLEKAPTRQ